MIQTSEAFHKAIRNDELQMPLFIFDNCAITKTDLSATNGFQFTENVMEDDDFAPGACSAASITFNLMNEHDEWSEFTFGEFKAMLGVRTYHQRKNFLDVCVVNAEANEIVGSASEPYLTFNGSAVSEMTEPVYAIALFEDKLFAFTEDGYVSFSYTASGLTLSDFTIHEAPISENAKRWKAQRLGICYGHIVDGITTGLSSENCMILNGETYIDGYEMISLGIFNAERPTFSTKKQLSVSCIDRMDQFDKTYDSTGMTFPMTLYELLRNICGKVNVPISTSEIDNGNISIPSAPDFGDSTYKDILKYIGELSGTFAKMSRAGELEMKWLGDSGFTLDGHDYSECSIGYYNTAGVDQVVSRQYSGNDVTSGSGGNILYIQNNPIAKLIASLG